VQGQVVLAFIMVQPAAYRENAVTFLPPEVIRTLGSFVCLELVYSLRGSAVEGLHLLNLAISFLRVHEVDVGFLNNDFLCIGLLALRFARVNFIVKLALAAAPLEVTLVADRQLLNPHLVLGVRLDGDGPVAESPAHVLLFVDEVVFNVEKGNVLLSERRLEVLLEGLALNLEFLILRETPYWQGLPAFLVLGLLVFNRRSCSLR
jgi:hypothetical protein